MEKLLHVNVLNYTIISLIWHVHFCFQTPIDRLQALADMDCLESVEENDSCNTIIPSCCNVRSFNEKIVE